jgi:hypothetical protein
MDAIERVESEKPQVGLTLRVAEAITKRNLDYVSKPGELVESEFETGSLSAAARKAFALMLRKAGGEAAEDRVFTITKKELRRSHKGNERIQGVMDELIRVIVRIKTTSSKGRPATLSQSLLSRCVEETAEDGLSVVEFELSDALRSVLRGSDYYARVNLGVTLSLQSRYALTLYDLGCLVINRQNRSVRMPIVDLRRRLGVPDGSFKNYAEFRRDVLNKSKAEIDQLADFTVDWTEIRGVGRGNPVKEVVLNFEPKVDEDQEATARELDRPRVGRRARRDGTVEEVVPTPLPRLSQDSLFPTGSIHFCDDQRLLTIVSDFGGGWDKNLLADGYRAFMSEKLKTLRGDRLYKSWEGYCKGYVRTHGRA